MEIAVIAILVIVIVDLSASYFWNSTYLRFGIPVYKRHVSIRGGDSALPKDVDLSAEFVAGVAGPAMIFKSISDTEIAFHEKFFDFSSKRSKATMHGLISLTPDRRGIQVTGLLYWTTVALGAALIYGLYFLSGIPLRFIIDNSWRTLITFTLIVAVLVFTHIKQIRRYNLVTEYLRGKYEGTPSPQPLSREEREL